MKKSFEIKSGKVTISDPCYEKGCWCAISDIPAKNGEWIAEVETIDEGDFGIRNAVLKAHHVDYPVEADKEIGRIGVDAGQAGIFDSEIYPDNDDPQCYMDGDPKGFYDLCCNITCNALPNQKTKSWGLVYSFRTEDNIPEPKNIRGVVSSSGFGDSTYPVYGNKVNGKLVAIKIVFIGDNEDEE